MSISPPNTWGICHWQTCTLFWLTLKVQAVDSSSVSPPHHHLFIHHYAYNNFSVQITQVPLSIIKYCLILSPFHVSQDQLILHANNGKASILLFFFLLFLLSEIFFSEVNILLSGFKWCLDHNQWERLREIFNTQRIM